MPAVDSFRATLFDMDGVLADTAASVVAFWQALADEHKITITEEDRVAHIYGRTVDDTLDSLFSVLDLEARRGIHARLQIYEDSLTYTGIAGAIPLLRELKCFDIPAVLVTSGSLAKVSRVVDHLGIAALLSDYVTSADITNGKPDPEPFLIGARKAGVPPSQCVAFEDAQGGVQSAVAAGTYCVGIGNETMRSTLLAAGARLVILDLTHVQIQPESGSDGGFTVSFNI